MKRHYTGIGSRETPPEVIAIMVGFAGALAAAGWCLRSGGADGADDAFERGCALAGGTMDIYLPWKGFNGRTGPLHGVCDAARALAASVHPAWDRLGQGPQKLHARNTYQCLGRQLDAPSELVVCWTPDGCESRTERSRATGGTATGIVLAADRGIPVFNLQREGSRHRLNAWLQEQGLGCRVATSSGRPPPVQEALF